MCPLLPETFGAKLFALFDPDPTLLPIRIRPGPAIIELSSLIRVRDPWRR
jgi:hypothetical protein